MNFSITDVYDNLDEVYDYEVFEKAFMNLVGKKMLLSMILCENEVPNEVYTLNKELYWKDWIMMDKLSVSIMKQLALNPYAYFVLLNTQKGKSYQMSRILKELTLSSTVSSAMSSAKHVAFVYLDNDKTLAEQTAKGFSSNPDLKLFILSSNHQKNNNLTTMKQYILGYEQGLHKQMPVILALSNPHQNDKVVQLLDFIISKVSTRNSLLRFTVLFDEADRVYPAVRDKVVMIENLDSEEKKETTLLMQISHNYALHQIVFVTATEGELLDEDYPEIYNAKFYKSDTEGANEFYSGIHTKDSVINIIGGRTYGKSKKKEVIGNPNYKILYHEDMEICTELKGNEFAKHILENFYDHFDEPITLPDKSTYFRKVIINSNNKKKEMVEIANHIVNTYKWHALTFNDLGITLYRYGEEPITFAKSKIPFNQSLFCIYKHYELNNKPLFIIGRKKVDRGLTFHYAPRKETSDSLTSKYIMFTKDILVSTDDTEGLIWTDLFLGSVTDQNTAVQKAGRCAGIIRHCPQYPEEMHYWTDIATAQMIISHNVLVDEINTRNNEEESISYKRFSTHMDLVLNNSDILLKNEYSAENLKHMRVPVIVKIDEDLIKEFLLLKSKMTKAQFLLAQLKRSNPMIHSKLKEYKNVGQISSSGLKGGLKSKEKLIHSSIRCAMEGKPVLIGNRKQDIGLNTWHCYIDPEDCLLCFNYSEYT